MVFDTRIVRSQYKFSDNKYTNQIFCVAKHAYTLVKIF